MSRPHTSLAILTTSLLCASAINAQDQLVKQALKKIGAVEAALQTLPAGDVRAANKLLGDLKWANKRLKAAYKKDTTFWKDAAKRLQAADKAIRAKAAATPPPAGQPAGQPTGAPAGKPAPQPAPKGTTKTGPVVGEQFAKLQQLDKEVRNGFANLKMLNKTFMGDAYRVGSTQKEISKLEARLAEFPSSDKNVQIVTKNLQQFRGLFDKWRAEYAADQKSAGDLAKKLDAISAKYASEAVPGPIYWPYEREKLTIWASRVRKLKDELPADVAVIQGATNNSMLGKKAKNMLHWVGRSIPRRLDEQLAEVRQICKSNAEESLRTAKILSEIKPDDKHAIVNRVLAEGALDRSMETLQKGFEAVDMAAALDQALKVTDGPDRAAQRKKIEDTIVKLRTLAKSSLKEVRMPKAVGVDDKTMAKLTKIAHETLAKKKYGTHPIQRLVVTSKLSRKEKKEGDIRGTVTGATITVYHYIWDEYRVVTAEKIGDEVWIFYNTLKYYHSSDTVTPQDKWILSKRFKSTAILPENVAK